MLIFITFFQVKKEEKFSSKIGTKGMYWLVMQNEQRYVENLWQLSFSIDYVIGLPCDLWQKSVTRFEKRFQGGNDELMQISK